MLSNQYIPYYYYVQRANVKLRSSKWHENQSEDAPDDDDDALCSLLAFGFVHDLESCAKQTIEKGTWE